jgi:hypothetical protein
MIRSNGFAAAVFLVLGTLPVLAWGDEPQAASPVPVTAHSSAEIDRLIADLASDDYTARESATESLAEMGLPAVKGLAAAAMGDNPEAAWRATAALENLAASTDETTLALIVAELQKSDRDARPKMAALVAELQNRQQQMQRGRAISKIRALGGVIGSNDSHPAPVFGGIVTFASPEAAGERIAIEALIADAVSVEPATEIVEIAVPVESTAEIAVDDPPALIDEPTSPAAEADEPAAPPELPAVEQELEAAEVVTDPAPPPDVLPELAPGELPIIEGEIGEAFVGDAIVAVGGPAPPAPVATDADSHVSTLTLNSSWKGGDDALALLKEIPELQHLVIEKAPLTDVAIQHLAALPNLTFLRVQGTSITGEGLRKLHAEKPNLNITTIGTALMGVSAATAEGGCLVSTVSPGSAAEQAGLQPGDYITHLNDVEIRSFIDLMIAVFERRPGDEVRVAYTRAGQSATTRATLQARP